MSRVAFKTVGCRLNQAETARMAAAFEQAGYQVVEPGGPSDVLVVHTCTITQNAERDCLREIRRFKRRNPEACAVLAGCAVEVDPERVQRESGADLVVGQAEKMELPDLLEAKFPSLRSRQEDVPASSRSSLPRFSTTRALVKVQDGCDFRCAYCIVPVARHAPVSRSITEIVDEVGGLAAEGYREFVLTGANVGCYEDGAHGLVNLLAALEALPDVERLRISSIEVTTTEKEIIDFMAASRKLCNYLHLPLQSGDDRILRAMGRRYTTARYRETVEYALEKIPHLGLGADIIVGLPGEDPTSFETTCRFVDSLPFSNLHVFPYSERDGTRAATMSGSVPVEERRRRAAELIAIGQRKSEAYAQSWVGEEVSFLVERVSHNGVAGGWTEEYVRIHAKGSHYQTNEIHRVRPNRACEGELYSE